jgi:hypothetical protein
MLLRMLRIVPRNRNNRRSQMILKSLPQSGNGMNGNSLNLKTPSLVAP